MRVRRLLACFLHGYYDWEAFVLGAVVVHLGCLSTGVDKDVKFSRLASFEWSSGAPSESGCSALTLKHRRLPAVGSTSLLASVHPCPPTPTRVYVRSTRSLLIDWRRSDHTPSHRAVASEVRFAFYPPCTCIAVPAGVHVLSLRCVCRLTCSNTPTLALRLRFTSHSSATADV